MSNATKRETELADIRERLAPVFGMLGVSFQKDFDRLLTLAKDGVNPTEFRAWLVDGIKRFVAGTTAVSRTTHGVGAEGQMDDPFELLEAVLEEEVRRMAAVDDTAKAPREPVANPRPTAKKRRRRGSGKGSKAQGSLLPMEKMDEFRLLLLEAEKRGVRAFSAMRRQVMAQLPSATQKKNLKFVCAGIMNRASGKWRGAYVARMLQNAQDRTAMLARLAKVYGVNEQTLANEARKNA